jgi:uncharacterized OB-fold protein
MPTSVPVVDGWFSTGPQPHLIGIRCADCGTYQFPPTGQWCPNPACVGDEMQEVALSRVGSVWSYTDAQYQPPPPFVARSEPYQPFAIAAVQLEEEKMVVLGQIADGYGVADLAVGCRVKLVVEPLDCQGGVTRLVWRWRPLGPSRATGEAEGLRR